MKIIFKCFLKYWQKNFFDIKYVRNSGAAWSILEGKTFLLIGISIVGSVSHSIGQIIMAMFLIRSNLMVMYLPWLLMFSIPTGIATGKIASKMLENFKELNESGVSLY